MHMNSELVVDWKFIIKLIHWLYNFLVLISFIQLFWIFIFSFLFVQDCPASMESSVRGDGQDCESEADCFGNDQHTDHGHHQTTEEQQREYTEEGMSNNHNPNHNSKPNHVCVCVKLDSKYCNVIYKL